MVTNELFSRKENRMFYVRSLSRLQRVIGGCIDRKNGALFRKYLAHLRYPDTSTPGFMLKYQDAVGEHMKSCQCCRGIYWVSKILWRKL